MKRISLIMISATLLLGSCYYESWNRAVTGNGDVVEESRNVTGFTGVHVSSAIDVYLSQGDDFEVTVEADENLMDVILTEKDGNILEVKTERVNIRHARSKKVHVTLPRLTELRISSAGDCVGQTPFECEDLRLSISSAGNLTIEVEADRINLDISSSGDARLAGSASYLDASLSSAGELSAFDLEAKKVDVNASSAGDARVYATEEISMNASSAGNIYYRGDPRVLQSRSSSAGDIIKRD